MSAATLTIPEAADLLGVSVNSAYTAAKTGELAGVPVIRVGARRLLIPRVPFLAVLGLEDGDPPKGPPEKCRRCYSVRTLMVESSGLTVAEYAEAKLLDVDKLRSWGVEDDKYAGRPAVRFTYWSSSVAKPEREEGRWRVSLNGQRNFVWVKGASAKRLYGWDRVNRDHPEVLLVEGESDCHTLWHAGWRNVLGVPGVECVPDSIAAQLAWAETVYVIDEQDDGSPRFLSTLTARLGDQIRIVTARPDAKDFSELWVELGGDQPRFVEAVRGILEDWREPSSEERDGKKPTSTPPRYRTDGDDEDAGPNPLPVLPNHLELYKPGDIGGHIPNPGDQIRTGPIGDWLDLVGPETEASDVGLGLGALTMFSAWLGRETRLKVGRVDHPSNLFGVLVGFTSVARKGTADGETLQLASSVDLDFVASNFSSGFGSGEALIERIADPIFNKKDEMVGGTYDQRLYIQESEFAKILRIAAREGNILSDVIRELFDGKKPVRNRTRGGGQLVSSSHCVGLFGGITPEELLAQYTELAATSGLGNRFLYGWSQSDKFLPGGGEEVDDSGIAGKVRAAMPAGRRFTLSPAASDWWNERYEHYRRSEHAAESVRAMVSRATDQILRIALVYAATEGANHVEVRHLEAGEAWVIHSADTVEATLGGLVRNRVAAKMLSLLRSSPGVPVNRRDVFNLFHGHETAEALDAAASELVHAGLAYQFDGESEKGRGGRPPTLIVATTPRKTRRDTGGRNEFVRSHRQKGRKPRPKPFVRKNTEKGTNPQVEEESKREQTGSLEALGRNLYTAESKQTPNAFSEAEQNLTDAGLDFDAETDRIAGL